jgi:putative membrane-bound dehydrogenase-like protein
MFSSFRIASSLLLLLALTADRAAAQKSPDEELKCLRFPADAEVALYAAEPMITNPAAIDVDTKGRVWVAEIEWYRKFANKPPADKIKVLEDTDGDGKADKATVFAEGIYAPMSICVAGPKVFVATSPDLWLFEDNDGDLKADGPPKKILTGFGGYNHDHGAHSLVLGPDHKWWMAHGDTGFNVEGPDGSKIQSPKGAMIRGEMDMTKLERLAWNFRNPYEIAVSSFGEAFCSDNDNDGNRSVRICWILEGGDYGWFGRPGPKFPHRTPYGEAWHFRGAIPGFVPGTLVTGFGSPCGMCYYEGDAFPNLKNMPLHCDAGPREVRAYPHTKAGAGYKAASNNLVTSDEDPYFRPDDVCAMPDGSLLIADWYDGGVGGHAYNNPSQGRIFRMVPKGKQPERVGKPGPYTSTADAIEALKNPNLATQFLARERLLADGQVAVPALVELMKSADKNYTARAMWLLDRIGGPAREQVVKLLHCEDPSLEALAFRILRRHLDDAALTAKLLQQCGLPTVTDELAREHLLFLAKRPDAEAVERIAAIAARYQGGDRFFAETVNIAARGREAAVLAAILKHNPVPATKLEMLVLFDRQAAVKQLAQIVSDGTIDVAGRSAALDKLGVLLDEGAFQAMTAVAAAREFLPDVRARAVEWLLSDASPTGLWSGLIGSADASVTAWTDYKPKQPFDGRAQLTAAVREMLNDEAMRGPALTLVEQARLTDLEPEVAALLNSKSLDAATRAAVVKTSVALTFDSVGDVFAKLAAGDNPALRREAIVGLVEMQRWDDVKKSLKNEADAKLIVEKMVGSTGGALHLLKWMDQNLLNDEARKLAINGASQHPDVNVRALFEKFVPEAQRPQRLGSVVKAEEILKLMGDPIRGEQVYNKSSASQCKNCHVIRGQGKDLGPELSLIGKKYERGALLETILEPSKAISHGYETYVAETTDGQIFAGFLLQQNKSSITLRGADGKQLRLDAKKVESLTKSEKSIMPELVLRDVTAQDAADLLAYLMTLK